MYNFIHISDLHLAPMPAVSWTQLLNKRVIGYLNWRFNRQSSMKTGAFEAIRQSIYKCSYQHLAVSGDIVNLALPQEFKNARKTIASLGTAENVSLVFGNHDAYVPGAFAQACQTFAPWVTADAELQNNSTDTFPYMRIRDNVAFIGVSSAVATLPFFASGYFGAIQAQKLASLLSYAKKKNLFRVVMIHHPPFQYATSWYKTLWGIKRFQKQIADFGAELILHGHTHLPTLTFIPGESLEPHLLNADKKNNKNKMVKKVPVVGVASMAQEYGGHKPAAGYNLFSVQKSKKGQWQCLLRRYAITDKNNTIALVERKKLL